MSRYLLFLFCLLCGALNAQPSDSTLIEVFVEGLTPGKVRVVGTYGDQNYLADSTVADDKGHFVIRRKDALLSGYYTFLLPGQKNFAVLVDTQDLHMTVRANVADIAGTLAVENGLNTELFYRNIRYQGKQDPELNKLIETMRKFGPGTHENAEAKARQAQILAERKTHLEEIYAAHPKAFFTKFKKAGANPDFVEFRKPNGTIDTMRQLVYYRSRFWDGVDFNDSRLLYTPVVVNKLRRYVKELTPQNPDSLIQATDVLLGKVMPYKPYFIFFTNWIGAQHENTKTNVMDGEAVYVHIIQKYLTPKLAGDWIPAEDLERLSKKAGEMQASLLGRKGPDVRAADVNGQMKSIYEMTAPLIVVFMFSPDCEHCQKDAPEIQRIYEKWKTRGVDFYGIAVNTTEEEWKPFLQKNKFTFTNVFDPTNRAIYAKYFVDITPELYVLNKDRIIVAKNLKAEQLETIFEREFKKMGQ
jgi:peroxiredoxin